MKFLSKILKYDFLIVFLLATTITIPFTYPLINSIGEGQIGRGGDYHQFIWDLWWVKKAVLSSEYSIMFTPMQY